MPFTKCNICKNPQKYENAQDIKEIYSNVRKFKEKKFTVWRCSNCRTLHSKEEIDFEYYYKDYPVKNHVMNYATRRAFHNRLRMLKKHGLRKNHSILDFGCGEGLFVSYLQDCGYKAFGYDCYVEKYSDKKVLNNFYDTIVAYDVIEHVEQPIAFIEQLVSYLKRNGLIVIGTPNADNIDLSEPETYSLELHQPYHRHILSEEALLDIGLKAGLDIVKIYHRFYFDTLFPMVNTRFLKTYILHTGNFIDAIFEKPRVELLFSSPELLFYFFFGYFFPPPAHMEVFFRMKPSDL